MVFCTAIGPLRLTVLAHATEGGNASRRRSQRLNQQGRLRQQGRDLQQQLKEREARAAEEQQRGEWDDELALLPAREEGGEGGREEGVTSGDQATRELVQKLRGWPAEEAEAGAAAGGTPAAPAAEPAGVGSGEDDPSLPPIDVVEADYILEEGLPGVLSTPPGLSRPPPSRQAEALLAIMQAGEGVEEAIAQHREHIDEEMLRLLERRMQAAQQLEPEAQADVVEGLQLLRRRLKAEIDRQRAPPSLRLLDELLNILDPSGAGLTPTPGEREERRRQASVRLRAAFVGDLTAEADVLSLAAQLGGSGGTQLADQLVADPVDPSAFMADCTELLAAAQEQHAQLAAYLQQLPEEQDGTDEAAAGEAAAQRAQLEALLEERQAAAALVEEVLELAQAVSRRISGL